MAHTWAMHVVPEPSEGDFSPTLVRGLVDLEFWASGPDLSLDLGLSYWVHRSGISLEEARVAMLQVRRALLRAGGIDDRHEPYPLVGRDARSDVLTLGRYLSDLMVRAADSAGLTPAEVAEAALQAAA